MRTIIYFRQLPTLNGPEAELLRAAVENRGGAVISTFCDDPTITARGKYTGWRKMIGSLDQADQVVVGSVVHLPGQTVIDLLRILAVMNEHRVGLCLHREGINTDDGATAVLGLIAAYRAAKLSEAIRHGISKARAEGKVIGRPAVPNLVRRQIQTALANGAGIRPCGRRFNVSPGTVVNIRRMMDAEVDRLAA
jgi:DNA invertase Pin-like site-specific DNA recombinase